MHKAPLLVSQNMFFHKKIPTFWTPQHVSQLDCHHFKTGFLRMNYNLDKLSKIKTPIFRHYNNFLLKVPRAKGA